MYTLKELKAMQKPQLSMIVYDNEWQYEVADFKAMMIYGNVDEIAHFIFEMQSKQA